MKLRVVVLVTIMTVFVFVYQNCGGMRLSPIESSFTLSSQFQTYIKSLEGSSISSNIRTIFVVDTSGSNSLPSPAGVIPPVGPSDENRTRRFVPIENFVANAQGPSDKMYWSLLLFNTNVAFLPPTRTATNDSELFLTDSVLAALNITNLDSGNTNYIAALDQVKQLILTTAQQESAKNPPESSTYQIFFVSDGAPGERNSSGVFIPQSLADIKTRTQDVMNLRLSYRTSIDGIQLHTGLYYGGSAPDAGAQEALGEMARIGEGRFLEFTPNQDLDFTNFSGLTRTIQFEYRDFWMLNLNAVWEQFSYRRDSDGDGLSDQQESSRGSNPNSADSDNNGVNDLVEKQIFGSSCGAPGCAQTAGRRAFPQCSGSLPYSDTDKDLLNDCEERLLGSSPILFDSNGQGLPDVMTFRNGLSLTNAGAMYLDPDIDRVNSYMEIKRGLPPLIPNSQISASPIIDVGVTLISNGETQSEYRLDFRQLPYIQKSDQMILFWIEETPNILSRKVLRVFKIQTNGTLTEEGGP